jgi:hypothetical protein
LGMLVHSVVSFVDGALWGARICCSERVGADGVVRPLELQQAQRLGRGGSSAPAECAFRSSTRLSQGTKGG